MQGGVARWTSSTVVMAQTAQSDAGISRPKTEAGFEFPDIGFSSVSLPDISWPYITWPDFDMPEVSLPKINWPTFKSADNSSDAAQSVMRRDVSLQKPETSKIRNLGQSAQTIPMKTVKIVDVSPRLKPRFKSQSKASTGLRGPFQFEIEKPSHFGSFQDFRRNAKSKWMATKGWFKTKTDGLTEIQTLDDFARAADRLQDRVTPAGRSAKTSLKNKSFLYNKKQ